jgi:hypothetical protein
MSDFGVYQFGKRGRVAGICVGIRGRLYLVGATQGGIFYRFGAQIFSPKPGYWDTTFAVKTGIGEIDLMSKWGMKDEVLPVSFRPNWIHGSLHFRRTGIITFIITALNREMFPQMVRANVEDFAEHELEASRDYSKDIEERKQLDSY